MKVVLLCGKRTHHLKRGLLILGKNFSNYKVLQCLEKYLDGSEPFILKLLSFSKLGRYKV